mgnify:CR=1 FL=1
MKKFDPFYYENCFYKYKIKTNINEINQTIILLNSRKKIEQATTYQDLNILNFPILKNIKSQIIKILNSQNLILTNNWAQLYNKEDKHSVHTHSNSVYSGIIYLGPVKSSPTIFYDRNFNKYFHKSIKNTLILFPSHIPHEVECLNKNEKRLVISFNTKKNM